MGWRQVFLLGLNNPPPVLSPPCGMETAINSPSRPASVATIVLSPPCGMETRVCWVDRMVIDYCSEPTVWDGDGRLDNLKVRGKECSEPTVWDGDQDTDQSDTSHLPVLSPPCGMETLETEAKSPAFFDVLSPPCGMETKYCLRLPVFGFGF